MKKLISKLELERHAYAPELNKIRITNARRIGALRAEGITDIRKAKKVFRARWNNFAINCTSFYTVIATDSKGKDYSLDRIDTRFLSLQEVFKKTREYFPNDKLSLHRFKA